MATPPLSMSAKLYQERKLPEDRTTRRLPSPRFDLEQNPIVTLSLSPPFPTPDALQVEGNHPPDAGVTEPWPWQGQEEIT